MKGKLAMNESILIIKNKSKIVSEIRIAQNTASSFNIPLRLVPALLGKIRIPARIDEYLYALLNKYRILSYSGSIPGFAGSKLKYQDKGQEWERMDFRPSNEDWVELRILASMHGMTMNKFFVMLLDLDLSEFGEAVEQAMKGVVPTDLLIRPIVYTQRLHKVVGTLTKSARFAAPTHRFFRR